MNTLLLIGLFLVMGLAALVAARALGKHSSMETRAVADLPRELRELLLKEDVERWCQQCRLTRLVCDLHPREAYEMCECSDGVPRPCPGCTEYDVTALLEELAELRSARRGTS